MEIRNIASADTQIPAAATKLEKVEVKSEEKMKSENRAEVTSGQKEKSHSDVTYSSVSKDGDTLELSDDKKSSNDSADKIVIKEENVSAQSAKMTDAELTNCSSVKLKQLLQQGKISKQQYDKAIKKFDLKED